MAKQKQTWDTRAWLIGLLGGGASGSLSAWSGYPPVERRLNTLPHLPQFGQHSADVISILFGIVSLLVLPGLLSGLSRRMTFFWGLIPLLLFMLSMNAEDLCENGMKSVVHEWWVNLIILGGCLLISSGPVSLFRWLRVRAKRRHGILLASYQAMREAASVPQEGVWPPPPGYRNETEKGKG